MVRSIDPRRETLRAIQWQSSKPPYCLELMSRTPSWQRSCATASTDRTYDRKRSDPRAAPPLAGRGPSTYEAGACSRGSRWCDRSIRDVRHSVQSSGNLRNRHTVWNSCRETHLGSGHVRPHQQTGHMIASDPIRALHLLLRAGGRPHMDCPVKPRIKSGEGNDTGEVNRMEKSSGLASLHSRIEKRNVLGVGALRDRLQE